MAKYRHNQRLKLGDYKVQDDIYGLVYLRSECRMTWDNKLAPIDYYDEKHPQLIIRPRKDKQSVRDARPIPENDDGLIFGEGNAEDL